MLSGIDLNTAVNPNEAIQRSIRTVSQKVSIPDASLRIPYLIYNGVFDYASPANIFSGSFTDFRPQGVSRNYNDLVYRQQVEQFDLTKSFSYNGVKVVFEYANGVPILRVVSARTTQKTVIDTMSAIGNWKTGGNASGLIVDSTVYYQSPAALAFNLAANGTQGYIEETLSNPTNLSSYMSTGVAFVAVYLPSASIATAVTSIGIRLGTDPLNYFDVSNTVSQIGSFQGNTYFLVPLALANATQVGSVNMSKIQYARVYLNYTSATIINNVRVGAFFISLPFPYELLYQSSAVFLPQVGANIGIPQQTITTDNDQIMLSDDIYNIVQHEAALAIAMDNGAAFDNPVVTQINSLLNGTRTRTGIVVTYGLYDLYRSRHPSEEIPTVGSYYDSDDGGGGRGY